MERIYSERMWALYRALDRSLDPRGPDVLHEIAAEHLSGGSLVLDAGCRDAEHLIRLVQANDARGVGVDPMPWHIARAKIAVAEAHLEDRIQILHGVMQNLPYADNHFDFIWCRDVLEQVDELEAALLESARVLKPDGRMLAYTVFVTDELTAAEAEILNRHLGNIPENLVQRHVEDAFAAAGLVIERQDTFGTEWREYAEERTGSVSRSLLRLARLRRHRHTIIETHGSDIFYHVQANMLWEIFQFLGKLEPNVYVLRLAE
jgi:SAM-dependent methyltransferase